MNRLEFIMVLGPMWSYKTTTLLHFMNKKISEGKKCFVFAPSGTQRDERPFLKEAISVEWKENVEEDKRGEMALPLIVSSKDLEKKLSKLQLDENTWIFIDEIQFFDIDVKDVLEKYSTKCNIAVAGLDKNYTSRFFETPKAVSKLATQIIFKKADCYYCMQPARFYEKRPGAKEGIGGSDSYRPACYKCVYLESKTLRW